ncbi:hypothetical protein HJB67_12945 [Rhizobium lentis]|uniref:hypothetical protein n=1 Tax=Rhizobium lentis TaxID=1138194 RepID=UPI001C831809|nr:hypothetical protein [Rhizobium lentis]MBX5010862.1 hypothetical protein [Rhizobium lentis]
MDDETKALILEAIADLKRGDTEAALLVLERTVRPAREAKEGARWDYLSHMREQRAGL